MAAVIPHVLDVRVQGRAGLIIASPSHLFQHKRRKSFDESVKHGIVSTMKLRVYFNLLKKKLSVQAKNERGDWIVIRHADTIALKNVEFKVSEAGRQRVIREKRKNVHAFIVGEEAKWSELPINHQIVRYNPYKWSSFVDIFEKPVHKASFVRLQGREIVAAT
jgi:hypothetical protein